MAFLSLLQGFKQNNSKIRICLKDGNQHRGTVAAIADGMITMQTGTASHVSVKVFFEVSSISSVQDC